MVKEAYFSLIWSVAAPCTVLYFQRFQRFHPRCPLPGRYCFQLARTQLSPALGQRLGAKHCEMLRWLLESMEAVGQAWCELEKARLHAWVFVAHSVFQYTAFAKYCSGFQWQLTQNKLRHDDEKPGPHVDPLWKNEANPGSCDTTWRQNIKA